MSTWLLTASPNYLAQAMNEIKEIDPNLTFARPIDPGIIPFESHLPDFNIHQGLRDLPPIFIRHIHPVQRTFELTKSPSDQKLIVEESSSLLSELPDGHQLGVQIRREQGTTLPFTTNELREAIALQIEQTFPGQVVLKNPEDVLSIFLTEDRGFIGLSTAANNLSDWPGGAMRLKMEPFYPARSRLKLEEAFYVFSLFQLDLVDALDIGAAPGGWTSFLLDQGFRVTAIDTGEMDARLLKKANLQFIKQNVQDARLPKESFDLLTCDMSWSPYITCQRIHDFAAQLREDGRAIVTIKLLHQKKVTKTIRDALEILNRNYQVLACKQLFHNRDEVTVYLRKRFR